MTQKDEFDFYGDQLKDAERQKKEKRGAEGFKPRVVSPRIMDPEKRVALMQALNKPTSEEQENMDALEETASQPEEEASFGPPPTEVEDYIDRLDIDLDAVVNGLKSSWEMTKSENIPEILPAEAKIVISKIRNLIESALVPYAKEYHDLLGEIIALFESAALEKGS